MNRLGARCLRHPPTVISGRSLYCFQYAVPDGYSKSEVPGIVAKNLKAVMHQRVGFYVQTQQTHCHGQLWRGLTPTDDPNDGNGIGRVVREIKDGGRMGNIYFIYYNHGFSERNTAYPFIKSRKINVSLRLATILTKSAATDAVGGGGRPWRQYHSLNKPYKAFAITVSGWSQGGIVETMRSHP